MATKNSENWLMKAIIGGVITLLVGIGLSMYNKSESSEPQQQEQGPVKGRDGATKIN